MKHYGVFQFKPEVSNKQMEICFETMQGMIGKIPGLLDMISGPFESDEGLNDGFTHGFTHGFITAFESLEARDAYLPHPIPERAKDVVVACLERVTV